MVYTIDLQWKEYRVDLEDFARWLRSNIPNYIGMSANAICQIHTSEEPTIQDRLALEEYWNSVTEESETEKIVHREALDRAVKYATDNLPYKPLAQWAPAEIKIFIKQPLSLEDREGLYALYPSA